MLQCLKSSRLSSTPTLRSIQKRTMAIPSETLLHESAGTTEPIGSEDHFELVRARKAEEDKVGMAEYELKDAFEKFGPLNRKPDFSQIFKYQLAVDRFKQSASFEEIPSWFIYKYLLQPFIAPLRRPNYIQRLNNMKDALSFIEETPNDIEKLNKLMYPDLVDTIKFAIISDDEEGIQFLFDYLHTHFGTGLPPDYLTFLFWALDSANVHLVDKLINVEKFKPKDITLSDTEVQLVKIASAQAQSQVLLLNWDTSQELDSFNISLIVESLSHDLSIKDSFRLVDHLKPLVTGELSVMDFDFLVQSLKRTLSRNSITRKRFEADEPSEFKKPRKIFIQRVDIKKTFDDASILGLEEDISNEAKTLFVNSFLKTVSELSNLSGVIYAYSLLPLDLVNTESWDIIFHACSRGSDTTLRSFEFFKQANSKVPLSKKSFGYLINSSIGSLDHRLWYYLHHYFKTYDEITPEVRHHLDYYLKIVAESHHESSDSKSIMELVSWSIDSKLSQREIVERTIESFGDPYFIETFKPITSAEVSEYDTIDSNTLKRLHFVL